MKILSINGSPRKNGNSDVLCQQFIKGAKESGHDVLEIRLAEKKINPCLACYHCFENQHQCIISDDMADIQQQIIDADIILLATPVYFYSLSAQMKIMIDRCLPHYREMKNKKFYFIATAADPQHDAVDEALASMRGFMRCLPNSVEMNVIYGTGTWDKGDVYNHPSYQKAYEIGKNLPKIF